jgi:hypothetical protein
MLRYLAPACGAAAGATRARCRMGAACCAQPLQRAVSRRPARARRGGRAQQALSWTPAAWGLWQAGGERPRPRRAQVRVFSSRDHTRALAAGDAWAAVGWSGDLLPLAERSSNVALTAPASGVPLWADLWAVPAGAAGGSEVGPAERCEPASAHAQRPAAARSWSGLRCSLA